MEPEQRLTQGLAQLGIPDTPGLTAALLAYLELLRRWSRAYNLTSITDPEDMAVRHLLDSLTARPYLAGATVLDAGTGAGLPGIPLALVEPGRRFTLLDSVGKKVRFVQQAVTELKLANVVPVQARLEQWQPGGTFDTVICRAFSSLAEFAAACGRFAAPGGRLVAMKGRRPDAELAALEAQDSPWRVSAVDKVSVPGLDAERHVVVLER